MRANATLRLTLSALLCALCAVLSQVQIPIPPVPVSLSLLAVYLCGALLGARRGAAALCCYVGLGALGVPVYAGFSGGISVLFGPTGGFLFGYILCAWLIGALTQRFGFRRWRLLLAMALGTLLCYVSGTAWFMLVTGTELMGSLTACVFPFIPGDLLKIMLAAALCRRLQKPLHSIGLCA